MQYLSDEWMTAAAAALEAADGPALEAADGPAVDGAEPVWIQYEITGAPGGKTAYALQVGPDGVTLEPGTHNGAEVGFALDYDTSAEIARGDLSAQAAFMQGRLKLTGDVNVLIHQHAALDGLGDALADVRADTTY